jgi:hypothetical protein
VFSSGSNQVSWVSSTHSWARGAIFWCSDIGKDMLLARGFDVGTSTVLPTMLIGTIVQVVNQPIVRATITIQDPSSPYKSTLDAIRSIAATKGVGKLWHGTSAGVMKAVPKYVTAIAMKDFVDARLPRFGSKELPPSQNEELVRSAIKSVCAGVAGAALTNPLDVLRNEMFKTDLGFVATLRRLTEKEGASFLVRGVEKNLVAVAVPIAVTIFASDALVGLKRLH